MASRERERQLARERYERQQVRRTAARARARQRRQIVGAVVGVLAVVAGALLLVKLLGSDSSTTAQPKDTTSVSATPSVTPSATPSATPSGVSVCPPPPTAKPKTLTFPAEPPLTAKKTAYTATLTTNCGDVAVELYGDKAPHAVNSFLFLAGKGYFDNSPCHRLTNTGIFVLQCGDPTGTGRGGPGYKFPDENLPKAGAKNYPAGTLAMANSGPATNGSQFFIVYKDTQLGPAYTIFGKILRGAAVVDKVRLKGVTGGTADGPPAQKISILSVKTVAGIK